GHHAVIILRGQRLEFVVVAASAAERHPQKYLRCGTDYVIELIEAIFLGIGRLIVPRTQPVIAERDERLSRGVWQLVPGKLLENETVERPVLIERPDHVVAVSPSVRLGGVALVAIGLGVADQVQPVPSPAFTIGRAREQLIYELFKSARIFEKGFL